MSSAPAPAKGAPETKAAAPKKAGIDYSKFDNIEDSDDEKPKESATASAKPAEKPHCHNCHKDISKPLRCGICKKVEYCSAQCQKDDWRYHKRVCKKPEAPKAKTEERKPPPPSEDGERKRREEEKVVETEESLTWYRHREWKPEEGKKEFKPAQIAAEVVREAEAAKPAAGSAWNKAGTWEDKDVTEEAKRTLGERLAESLPSVDVGGGSLACEGVDEVSGDASKPVIRGKQRHMFDLGFKVKFAFRWMEADGQRQAKGDVEVSDFTNDTFTEGVLSEPALRVSFSDASKLEAARRKAVQAALGATQWPPEAGTLMHGLAAKMRQWAEEYQGGS
mmetsp:Transcript_91900/g.291552  ORF Transcript_91900/g.291552 Transcript_91900/m.291552 type:complete len:335 (-) Transcript_91900:100-1104(-)